MNRRTNIYSQDPAQSITDEKGRYDFSHFSAHEAGIIRAVLRDVITSYPQKYHSLYLAANSESIKYKARPVLFDCVTIISTGVSQPGDCLARARAYTSKGYYYVEQALYWYEQYFAKTDEGVMSELPLIYYPRFLYTSVAKLYEEMGYYEKALQYVDLMQYHRGIPIPPDWEDIKTESSIAMEERTRSMDQKMEEDWKNKLCTKMERFTSKPPSKQMGEKRKNLENDIHKAANFFLAELQMR